MEIPTSLKRLIRMVMRGFYSVEHILVVDMLIRKPCMKEDELETLLKFEKKFLRSVIAQLKNDKILKSKLKMETGPDGKTTRHNYYYINYRGFVNVVKYKLDHMRRKIETEERDSTSRASFICTSCKKTFTDLEADQLCDLTTGEFRCSYCGDLVEEDPNVLPKADSRLILAKFNEQIEPLYILLKEVEDLKLPSDLLEPEPIESSTTTVKAEQGSAEDVFNSRVWKESDKNRGINSEYENMLFNEQSLTVKIESVSDSIIDKGNQKEQLDGSSIKKEQPSWLTESTVYETSQSSVSNSKFFNDKDTLSHNHSPADDSVGSAKEILEALLVHEKQQENATSALTAIQGSESNDFFGIGGTESGNMNDSYNTDQVMDSDDEEAEERTPMVNVGGQMVPLNDITDDHISQMNAYDKEEYIRLTQEVYAHIYE